jgi:hypothetical protein
MAEGVQEGQELSRRLTQPGRNAGQARTGCGGYFSGSAWQRMKIELRPTT